MKLIIAGASGFVATEVLRQCLRNSRITTVIALARRPVTAPSGADSAKLKTVIIKDYEQYPEDVKKELGGADACIWTVAITPTKSKTMAFDEVYRICHTCTMAGLRALHEAGQARPFRFLYMSGAAAERDQTKKPMILGQYCLMRGETENQIMAFAAEHKGEIEATVAKAGFITGKEGIAFSVLGSALRATNIVASINVQEIAAAMIDQVINGFEKDPLLNEDLRLIGARALREM